MASVPLYEQFRPKTLEAVVAQPKAVAVCRRLIDAGAGGRAVLFEGPSASGKTTLARIVAASVADPFFVEECVADDLTAARLSDWERSMHLSAWGKGGRAFIVNEIHGASAALQRRLDQLLEGNLPSHVVFLATTTWDGSDALFDGIDGAPFMSRFLRVKLTNQGCAEPFAAMLRDHAQAAGLDGQPVEEYLKLIRRTKNLRAAYQAVESGEMIR